MVWKRVFLVGFAILLVASLVSCSESHQPVGFEPPDEITEEMEYQTIEMLARVFVMDDEFEDLIRGLDEEQILEMAPLEEFEEIMTSFPEADPNIRRVLLDRLQWWSDIVAVSERRQEEKDEHLRDLMVSGAYLIFTRSSDSSISRSLSTMAEVVGEDAAILIEYRELRERGEQLDIDEKLLAEYFREHYSVDAVRDRMEELND